MAQLGGGAIIAVISAPGYGALTFVLRVDDVAHNQEKASSVTTDARVQVTGIVIIPSFAWRTSQLWTL